MSKKTSINIYIDRFVGKISIGKKKTPENEIKDRFLKILLKASKLASRELEQNSRNGASTSHNKAAEDQISKTRS